MLVNTSKINIPEGYQFPPDLQSRTRDFKLSWFLIREVGVAAIPPTGKSLFDKTQLWGLEMPLTAISDFYSPPNAHLAEDYLRFAVCKNEDIIDLAKERLRGLKKFMS